MKNITLCLLVVLLSSPWVWSRERKEFDSDVIYDETLIPHYDLPPLLVSAEGQKIETAEAWKTVRRPQIMSLFYKKGQSFPKAHEWGVLSAVAWGAMWAIIYARAVILSKCTIGSDFWTLPITTSTRSNIATLPMSKFS